MPKQYYAYVHLRPDREGIHSIFYVGKGTETRSNTILRKHSNHHSNIVRKFGIENISIRKIACDSEVHAFSLEISMIAVLRRLGVKICNQTNGGDGASGVVFSKERRERASLAMTGSGNYFFGKSHSIESRERISKGRMGKGVGAIRSQESRNNISKGRMGIKFSDQHRENLSIAKKGRTSNRLGVEVSLETREKMSIAKKGKKQSPESIAKRVLAMTGKKRSDNAIAIIKAARNTPISKARTSVASSMVWAKRKGIPFSLIPRVYSA